MARFTQRFNAELADTYNLTPEDVADAIYIGSIHSADGPVDSKNISVSYEQLYPDAIRPDYVDHCVCGVRIKENCHVYSPSRGITICVGSECVLRFCPTGTKRCCTRCHEPTRVHTSICKNCKSVVARLEADEIEAARIIEVNRRIIAKLCISCAGTVKQPFTTCYQCRYPNRCACGARCAAKFKKCFTCK
jgi:hypothetical protein